MEDASTAEGSDSAKKARGKWAQLAATAESPASATKGRGKGAAGSASTTKGLGKGGKRGGHRRRLRLYARPWEGACAGKTAGPKDSAGHG